MKPRDYLDRIQKIDNDIKQLAEERNNLILDLRDEIYDYDCEIWNKEEYYFLSNVFRDVRCQIHDRMLGSDIESYRDKLEFLIKMMEDYPL